MAALTTSDPYDNMLPDKSQIEDVMGAAGITENDTILVYDCTANMQAARVQWTLNYYNNFNIRVISGGLEALVRAGAETSTEAAVLPAAEYRCGDKQRKLLVNYDYIQSLIDTPEEGTVIIDTRSNEEYYAGTIPGSIHIEYIWNNYANGEYKIPRDLQSTYLGKDVDPGMKIILFCKTSVRAAQTYSALKDAGYQDVRVYDGAWLEYSDLQDPATAPEATTVPTVQDAS
jgi:thiosulfate/3-mercaptopyruvate sulfurtransferase